MNPFALDRSVAVVTGGGNGIGQATALALGAAGASVAVLDRDGDAAAAVCDELSAAGIPALGIGVDVTDRPRVDAAIASVADGLGVPTVVVANAGYGRFGAFVDIEPRVWQRHLDVNLTGTFHVVQSAVRVMSNGGSIVLTGSTASSFPCDLFSAYATTKAGVAMLARSLAAELGPRRIRVNAVLPGVIQSAMTESILDDPTTRRLVEQETPLGRVGEPSDVADVIVFLASDASRYVTGNAILVDGGQTTHGFPRWFSVDAAAGGEYGSHGERMAAFAT